MSRETQSRSAWCASFCGGASSGADKMPPPQDGHSKGVEYTIKGQRKGPGRSPNVGEQHGVGRDRAARSRPGSDPQKGVGRVQEGA